MRQIFRCVILLSLLFTAGGQSMSLANEPLLMVSSFAPGAQGGIEAIRLNLATGTLTSVHRTAGVENPFYLAITPDRKFLYSIFAPSFGGTEPEQIAAFSLDAAAGTLMPLNRQTTRGTASCFLEVDGTGKSLLLANYLTGSVASYRIMADGMLSEPVTFIQHTGSSVDSSRQKEPHAHCFILSPDNRFAYAADLGLDQIVCYELSAESAVLQPAPQPFVRTVPGAGPRHLTFHPKGQFLYAINELKNSVSVFRFLPESGMLIERQTVSTLPSDFSGTSYCADVRITPDGRFLYGTNRGHDSIAVFQIAEDGLLSVVEVVPSRGKGPQNLAISNDGQWLLCANMPGNNLAVFRINAADGKLTATGTPLEIVSPSCIRILN
jgi:6-phosphogluconolactonase